MRKKFFESCMFQNMTCTDIFHVLKENLIFVEKQFGLVCGFVIFVPDAAHSD